MSWLRRCAPFVAGWVLAVSWPGIVHAQARITGADVQGTVRDQSGAPMEGANVTAVNVATNVPRGALTDTRGRYFLGALPPGTYRLRAELLGFQGQSMEGLVLQLGQSVEREFTLRVAPTQETITVAYDAPLLDSRRTALSFVLSQGKIDGLPINGRDFIGFSVITPGVTTDRTPTGSGSTGVIATSGLTFLGQSARGNNVMVDGLDNNDVTNGGVRGLFSQEAIREFQVLTDSYSAEFGRALGGVVNIVTKSGTNDLHGSAFYFFRDERLNAKDHFERFDLFGNPIDRPQAPFHQAQWGATLGGPLKRDKSFFFLSYEDTDVQDNNFVTIDAQAAAALRSAGFPVELGNVAYNRRGRQALAKLDHQWTPSHILVLRGSYSKTLNENAERFGGLVARSSGGVQHREDWFASAFETDILSPRWVNEARVEVARLQETIEGLDPRCNGACDAYDEGGPSVILGGQALVGRFLTTPHRRHTYRLQGSETVSFFAGGHFLKAGVDFIYEDNRTVSVPLYFGGTYVFAPLPGTALAAVGLPPRSTPLSAVEALTLGLPAVYLQGYGDPNGAQPYRDFSAFLQDEWRLTSRLTIKPGLRYQRQFWAPRTFDVSSIGGARFQYPQSRGNDDLAPRLAVSYDLSGRGSTVIHAAAGLFYSASPSGMMESSLIVDGTAHVRTLAVPFPSSVLAWRTPGRRLPEPATPYPTTVITVAPGIGTPYTRRGSFGFEQALGRDLSLAADAIYVEGRDLIGELNYNPVLPSLGPGRRPNDVAGRGTSAPVLQYTSYGRSRYRGLAVALNKRLSHGYEFLASYTLSKAEDNTTDFLITPEDSGRGRNPAEPYGLPLGFDPERQWGPSINDQRHRFVLSGLVQLPWRFQLSTIVTAASGRPFTPLAGADLNGDGDSATDRARTNPADPSTSVGRNSQITADQFNVDLRLSKKIGLGNARFLEAIAEGFNVFDRVNYSDVNNVFGTGAFPNNPQRDAQGRVTYGLYQKALAPRQVQLALKLVF